MTTPQLDERASRRADWLGGRPLRLADGQEWLLPTPTPDVRPAPGGCGCSAPDPPDPDAFPALDVAALEELAGAEAGSPRAPALAIEIGRALLLRNYRLDSEQLAALLRVDDPAILAALQAHAARVAGGWRSPRRSAAWPSSRGRSRAWSARSATSNGRSGTTWPSVEPRRGDPTAMGQLWAELRAAINRLNVLVLDAADLLRRIRDLEQQIREGRR